MGNPKIVLGLPILAIGIIFIVFNNESINGIWMLFLSSIVLFLCFILSAPIRRNMWFLLFAFILFMLSVYFVISSFIYELHPSFLLICLSIGYFLAFLFLQNIHTFRSKTWLMYHGLFLFFIGLFWLFAFSIWPYVFVVGGIIILMTKRK